VRCLPRCYFEPVGSVKRLLVIALAACAGFAVTPHRAAADTCGISGQGTAWIDFADGSVPFWQVFGRPGVIAAAANFIYPPQLRALGAKTVYWDMYLPRRVGTPLEPFDPALVIDRANRIYDTAAMSSGCGQPLIAENELNGASLITPWSATNAQYRRNVLIYVQTLAARGAHPVLLVPGTPYMGGEAADWWRQVANYADIVRESYFAAPTIAKQGSRAGSRVLRTLFRRRIAEFTSVGISPRKLGLMLGFQTTPGSGGRERASTQSWLEVTKLQTLAARQVASELNLRSVWSWGWGVWSKGEDDPDKPAAACVYLWTRDPRLCDGPAAAGPTFNTSRVEGQLVFPSGTRCTVAGKRVQSAAIADLAPVTGDGEVAFTAVFARVVASLGAPVKPKQVAFAEKAVVAGRFGGFAAYRAALGRAHASVGAARGVIADELRRAQIESHMRVGNPSAEDVQSYYDSYGSTLARLVETKTPAPWLGNRKRGFALESSAPPQLFGLPQARWVSVRTMLGTYEVRAVEPAVPLAALPLEMARVPVSVALKGLARDQRYESWLLSRERTLVELATCRKDDLPALGIVPLTDYLPFLAAQ
jgi:hypothetical protein